MKNEIRKFYDIVIIGTGAGGGAIGYSLRDSALKILFIERGDFIPKDHRNQDPVSVVRNKCYHTTEKWKTKNGKYLKPYQCYVVGGNTKVYGACLPRFRERDFKAVEHQDGVSPEWPITYQELEPYYLLAEKLFFVHGAPGEDPTSPSRSAPFPYPAINHEPYIQDFLDKLRKNNLKPFPLPIGIDLRPDGKCIYCRTCEMYPCNFDAKGDAEVCCIKPVLRNPNYELLTNTYANRLITSNKGDRVIAVEVNQNGDRYRIEGNHFVVSCGAINSAALLLRSANERHPNGLANSSGLVGRNLMGHNVTFYFGFHGRRMNFTTFPKTWNVNDFYYEGPGYKYPMGNIQASGHWQLHHFFGPHLTQQFLKILTEGRFINFASISEDLPNIENRIIVENDRKIKVFYEKPSNIIAHRRLTKLVKNLMKKIGYPVTIDVDLSRNIAGKIAHQCGTAKFGNDPACSVLNEYCRTHDIENLYIVDSSFFPSSAAINPTLTIIAQSLRVGEYLLKNLKHSKGI